MNTFNNLHIFVHLLAFPSACAFIPWFSHRCKYYWHKSQ